MFLATEYSLDSAFFLAKATSRFCEGSSLKELITPVKTLEVFASIQDRLSWNASDLS